MQNTGMSAAYLEDGAATLASSHDAASKEELPDSVDLLAIFLCALIAVLQPVLIPSGNGSAIVYTEYIDALDFESRRFDLVDDPSEGARSIRTGEDVLVHEQAPDQIFILPGRSESSDLQDEDSVIVEQVADFAHEALIAADTDVLSLLERDNLGVSACWSIGNIMSVHG